MTSHAVVIAGGGPTGLGRQRQAAWVAELAVPIYRERDVTGFSQDDSGVDVELADGRSLLVGDRLAIVVLHTRVDETAGRMSSTRAFRAAR
jgi:hypothetical protein